MNRRLRTMSLAAVVAVAVAGGYQLRGARASGIPGMNTLSYSGTLINNGQPENGSHFILLKLWNKGNASAACSTIPAGDTTVVNGRFTIPLDSSCVPVIHQSPDVEVEVVVDGASMGKTALAAVPYAVEADTASNFAPGSAIANLVPPGTVVPYAGVVTGAVKPPPGWLLCDGAAVNRAQNAALFTAIGTGWGAGDGATTFNTPDLRGLFLRGVDANSLKDPDASSRTAIQSGGNTGAKVGTAEGAKTALPQSAFSTSADGNHTHVIGLQKDGAFTAGNLDFPGGAPVTYHFGPSGYGDVNGGSTSVAGSHSHSIVGGGDAETRPINAAVNYIIKL